MKIEAGKLLLGRIFKEFVNKTVNNEISHLPSEAADDRESYALAVSTQNNRLDAIQKIIDIRKNGLLETDRDVVARVQVVSGVPQVIVETFGHRFAFEDVNERLVFLYMF